MGVRNFICRKHTYADMGTALAVSLQSFLTLQAQSSLQAGITSANEEEPKLSCID